MSERYPAFPPRNPNPPYKRIATEEAWLPTNILDLYRKEIAEKNINDAGFNALWTFFVGDSELARGHQRRIQSLGEERLSDMDASGIDMAVLSLGSPGVQLFDAATATALARDANDQMAEGLQSTPTAMSGLPPFRPSTPRTARRNWNAA